MISDDIDDIRAGLNSLRKSMESMQTVRQAVTNMPESHDKRDAEIALIHAENMAAVAERMFRSALAESREARKSANGPYADWTSDLEPEVE